MSNERIIWDYLKSQGLNNYGTAGLMGNLFAESALNPQNLQNTFEKKLNYTDATYTAAVDNGSYGNFVRDSAGYGLAQWTFWSRKQNLLNFAKEKGKSIGDLNMQLEFLQQELKAYKLWDLLKTSKSVLEASNLILLQFEKPANQGPEVQQKRASYGQQYYDRNATVETKPQQQQGGKQMKYSASNPPLKCLMTNSTCYKQTRTMKVLGVLWHSTGANNPNLKRYVQPSDNAADKAKWIELLGKNQYGNDWNHITHQAGLNAWIGKLADGTVTTVQTMPWDYRPWGCGSGSKGSCNSGWIQFEICEDGLTDKAYFDKVYKEACELTAYLCKLYNLDPNGTVSYNGVQVPVILCHQDSYKLGLGGNHGDIYHWFPKFGKNMETVRKDVADLMGSVPAAPATSVRYQGRVTASALNCRASAPSGRVVKTYPNGTVVTISKEQDGWGYTGEGWVSLQYIDKIEQQQPAPVTPTTPPVVNNKEDEEMTQEKFNEMMDNYLIELAKRDAGTWSKEARDWCEKNGIFAGDGAGNMMYKKFLTREEAAVLFYRLHGKK